MLPIVEGVNRAHPLNRGLVSWWLALPNQARGVMWRDLVGRNHGTLTNMDPATDWVGARGRPGGFGALDLDGSNDYANIGSGAVLTAGVPFTISWWERPFASSPSFAGRLLLDISGAAADFNVFRSDQASYQYLSFGYINNPFNPRASSIPPMAASAGIWSHVVITGTDPTNTITSTCALYWNGAPATLATAGGFANPAGNRIGAYANGSGPNALMDDVRVWSRRLSANEVRALYNDSLGGYRDTLRWARTTRLPLIEEAVTYTYTATGGAVSAGAATVSRTLVSAVSGGATSAGAATISRTLAYAPSGGAVAAGSALLSATVVYVPSGGAIAAGAAAVSRTLIPPAPTGGAVSAGAAAFSATRTAPPPTGGAVSAGAATFYRSLVYTPTGGGQAAGSAALSRVLVYVTSGGAVSGGAATTYSPSGTMDLFSDGHTTLGPRGTLDLYADGHTPLLGPGGH